MGNYRTARSKVKFHHAICGESWYTTPNNFLRGTRCPVCNQSIGEKIIYNYLKAKNINFKIQYKLKGCKHKRTLSFDFAVIDKNDNLLLLIEYDGGLHFEAIDHFGGENQLEYIKMIDGVKNDYCRKNNISLIRITNEKEQEIHKELEKALNL